MNRGASALRHELCRSLRLGLSLRLPVGQRFGLGLRRVCLLHHIGLLLVGLPAHGFRRFGPRNPYVSLRLSLCVGLHLSLRLCPLCIHLRLGLRLGGLYLGDLRLSLRLSGHHLGGVRLSLCLLQSRR